MIFFGLAGEAGDEGRADGDAGDALAQLEHQLALVRRRDIPAHRRQHAVRGVLERDVDVLADMRQFGDRVDHLVGEVGRVGVHEPHPAVPAGVLIHGVVERPEQVGQSAGMTATRPNEPATDVVAPARRVLTDEVQFERAVFQQLARLGQDPVQRLGAHLAADRRDRAERALLVAALGDLQVRVVPGRQAHAGRVVLEVADALAVLAVHGQPDGVLAPLLRGLQGVARDPVLGLVRRLGEALALGSFTPHRPDDVVAIEHADHRVDARGPLQHLGPVTLHQAAGDHHPLQFAAVLLLDGLGDDFQRFLLGGLQEAAGVDHHRIGLLVGVHGDRRDAVLGEQPEHLLGVHEVFRAAEGDEGHR